MPDTEGQLKDSALLHLGGYSDDLTVVVLEGRGAMTNYCGDLVDVHKQFAEEFGDTGATITVTDENGETVGTYRVEYCRSGGVDGWGVTIELPGNCTVRVRPDNEDADDA